MNDATGAHAATPVVIRRATAMDAPRVSAFAAAAFREAFATQNTPADMETHLAGAFGPDLQAAEIADPSADVLVVEAPGDSAASPLLGYAHLLNSRAPACVAGDPPLEVKRFYVARAAHGRGVASALLAATLAAAQARGARTLWLGVWEHNARAIAFYRKHAFERVGEQRFVLGSDVQTDWVMTRPVVAAPAEPVG